MRRSNRDVGRVLVALLWVLSAGGCTALADEFVWVDKAAPDARPRGDAGEHGTVTRP